MTNRQEQTAQYRPESNLDNEDLINAFRAEMPPELRETRSLETPQSLGAAEAVVSGYRKMEERGASDDLLEAIIWGVTGIIPEQNTDYARDAAGIIAGQGVAANALARPPGERLHFTAMRASQYREVKETMEGSTSYKTQELMKLACQHNHICHLIEGGLINDAGYYAMALALSVLAPLPNSIGYGVPRNGMTEEILAILAEQQMLGIIQSAVSNDLLHYLQQARGADQRTAKLAELMLRNEGVGATLRKNPPIPPPSEREPATATAVLTLMSNAVQKKEGAHSLHSVIIQRLNERALNTPESAPRQLAVATAILE